jgi:hypothetical protein
MWLARLTKYLLQHRRRALAITFLTTFVPFLGVLSIVIAGFFTLYVGALEGAIFTLAASLPYLVSLLTGLYGEKTAELPFLLWSAISIAIACNVLTWAFAVMLRRGASLSLVLQVGALLGILVISLIHLFYPAIADWWEVQLRGYFNQTSPMIGSLLKGARSPAEAQAEMIAVSQHYATGFMAVAILINSVLQLLVAVWWQAKVFSPGLLGKELRHIRLSQQAAGLFVLSLVLSYLDNRVVLDMMPVVYVLFCVAGLSLVHYSFAVTGSKGWFLLALFYIVLVWSFPVSLFLMAMLALCDAWFDLRLKFGKVKK